MANTQSKTSKPIDRGIIHHIETITPEKAKEYLERNKKNRHLSKSSIAKYARDMQAGNWTLTGEPIKFDINGHLFDGQHRLHAVIESNTAIETLVVYNLPVVSKKNVDNGRKRQPRDLLSIDGMKNHTTVASTASILLGIKFNRDSSRIAWTTTEVLDMVKKHGPNLSYSVDFCLGRRLFLPASFLAAVHYIGKNLLGKEKEADKFVNVIRTGVPAYENDPAFQWRERLLREISSGRKLPRSTVLNTTIHAWNLFSTRQTPQKFMVKDKMVEFEGLDLNQL